ncbi:hypothetical protein EVAR_3964_1 [Eumeta japonica]|uniref:Uncharacterized protein n=1 Tax=Eumeta variegata TaxID=151549 RepID=A0A4C1STQ5_EUMVA|nr:hypothetical protein EVAR_3964_1 [Eumeta japonica]
MLCAASTRLTPNPLYSRLIGPSSVQSTPIDAPTALIHQQKVSLSLAQASEPKRDFDNIQKANSYDKTSPGKEIRTSIGIVIRVKIRIGFEFEIGKRSVTKKEETGLEFGIKIETGMELDQDQEKNEDLEKKQYQKG